MDHDDAKTPASLDEAFARLAESQRELTAEIKGIRTKPSWRSWLLAAAAAVTAFGVLSAGALAVGDKAGLHTDEEAATVAASQDATHAKLTTRMDGFDAKLAEIIKGLELEIGARQLQGKDVEAVADKNREQDRRIWRLEEERR